MMYEILLAMILYCIAITFDHIQTADFFVWCRVDCLLITIDLLKLFVSVGNTIWLRNYEYLLNIVTLFVRRIAATCN